MHSVKAKFHLISLLRERLIQNWGCGLFFLRKEGVSLGSFKTGLLKFPGLPLPARDK